MTSTQWHDEAVSNAIVRIHAISRTVKDFPHITEARQWQQTPDGVWTGGFWAGMLWLAHERDRDTESRERARHYTERLLPRAADTSNHDLGFMFVPSAVKGWQLTGEERYRRAALAAARSLASQYNRAARYIPGWGFFGKEDWSGNVLIDTLMNMPLLVWAAAQSGERDLLDIVAGHTATTLAHHFRDDGSVYHLFRFDPATGAPMGGDTYQGFAPGSAWSRGQAWAITGLAILGAELGDRTYVAAAEKAAAYFLSKLPDDGVPPWDFLAPGPGQPKDSSAGAIASYGLQRLFDVTGHRPYLQAAQMLLERLARTCANTGSQGGLLLHATADMPHGRGIDESTIYGDYYYLKSLVSLGRRLRTP